MCTINFSRSQICFFFYHSSRIIFMFVRRNYNTWMVAWLHVTFHMDNMRILYWLCKLYSVYCSRLQGPYTIYCKLYILNAINPIRIGLDDGWTIWTREDVVDGMCSMISFWILNSKLFLGYLFHLIGYLHRIYIGSMVEI